MQVETLIVGGGLSGLSLGYFLEPENTLILEKKEEAGGVIQHFDFQTMALERGPNTFMLKEGPATEMIRELNLQVIEASPQSRKRYLHDGQKFIPIQPLNVLGSLNDWKGRASLLRLLWDKPVQNDQSVGDFFRRKLGPTLYEALLPAAISGIYAAEPEELILKTAFPKVYALQNQGPSLIWSLIRQGFKSRTPRARSCTFKGGLGMLTRHLSRRIESKLRLNTEIQSILPSKDGYLIKTQNQIIQTRKLVFACPSREAAHLLKPLHSEIASLLLNIRYPSLRVQNLVYEQKQIQRPLAGFGYLNTRKSQASHLGAIFTNQVFPQCYPESLAVFTVFSRLTHHPESILSDIHQRFLIQGQAAASFQTEWPQAIPIYDKEHLAFVQKAPELKQMGIYFCTNYMNGPALGQCIENAHHLALELKRIKT